MPRPPSTTTIPPPSDPPSDPNSDPQGDPKPTPSDPNAKRVIDELKAAGDLYETGGVVAQAQAVGRFVWLLVGRSIGRLVLMFLIVLGALTVPTVLLTVWAFNLAGWGTGITLLLALIVLAPVATTLAFNWVTYRGLSDIVTELGFGKAVGEAFAGELDQRGVGRLDLQTFHQQLKAYTRREYDAAKPKGFRPHALVARAAEKAVFFVVRRAIGRLAKGCMVGTEVDVAQLAEAVGAKADGFALDYLRGILWDTTRAITGVGVLVVWAVIALIGTMF